MSAGRFIKTRYRARYAENIHPIRVQEETVNLTIGAVPNTPPAGAINNPISASVGRNKRQRGLIAASVALRAPATGQPAGYLPLGITRVPLLNPLIEAAATAADEETVVSYLGVEGWKVFGAVSEEEAK